MSNAAEYEIIKDGIANEGEAPRGDDIYYRCKRCGGIISCDPRENVGCPCGNIFIDYEYFRLVVEDGSQFQAIRKRA